MLLVNILPVAKCYFIRVYNSFDYLFGINCLLLDQDVRFLGRRSILKCMRTQNITYILP